MIVRGGRGRGVIKSGDLVGCGLTIPVAVLMKYVV